LSESKYADLLLQILQRERVLHIFGIPGGPILPLYDALFKNRKISHVLVRHEESAAFMAGAYAKVTGGIGVCMSTMGPGATNLVTGIATAYSDSTPVLALTGQMSTRLHGRGYQQDLDPVKIFGPITKYSTRVTRSDRLPEELLKSIRIATRGRPGPVHLDLPVDVLDSIVEAEIRLPDRSHVMRPPRMTQVESIQPATELLLLAERPVILAGGGVILSGASQELLQFAELLSIPVGTSYNGRGAIPEDHPLALGRLGEFTPRACSNLASHADVLLVLGYRFTDVSMDGWSLVPDAKIIQVDIDPSEIGIGQCADVEIVGDIRATIEAMFASATSQLKKLRSRNEWLQKVQEAKSDRLALIDSRASATAVPIRPQWIMKELRRVLRRDAILAAEAGRCKMWSATIFDVYEPGTWIHSGGFAPMGYALPAAIAAKLARPERQVVAICGDGGFQMLCSELAVSIENNAPIVVCIMNDSQLGIINLAQRSRYGARVIGTVFSRNPDFAKVAEAYGAEGVRIERPSEFTPAVEKALSSDRTTVLDILVDPLEDPIYRPTQ